MSVTLDHFVLYKPYRASQINNTPTIIFAASDYTAIIDSIILSSSGTVNTFVTIFVKTPVSEGVFSETVLFENLSLNPPQILEVIKDSMITLSPGEQLYAYSDDSSKRFNSNISYRELTELTEE